MNSDASFSSILGQLALNKKRKKKELKKKKPQGNKRQKIKVKT